MLLCGKLLEQFPICFFSHFFSKPGHTNLHVQRGCPNLYVYEAFLECYAAGFQTHAHFRTHTPLYYSLFVIFLGTMKASKQVMQIFLCARVYGLCRQSWENVLCLLFREVLWHAVFFCEKSDGFQECFVVPQSEGLIGGRGCFTKPIPPTPMLRM